MKHSMTLRPLVCSVALCCGTVALQAQPANVEQVVASTLPDAAAGLTLVQAMHEALVRYPAVRASQSQLASAQSDVDKAAAARWPVLSVGASAMQSSGVTKSTSSATPQASYALYAGGAIEAGIARAQLLAQAAEGKVSATRDEVAMQAGEAYLLWARALEQLVLAQQNWQMLDQIRADVAIIVEADQGRRVDMNQAQVRVKSASLTVTQREMELEQARLRLGRYVVSAIPPNPMAIDALPYVTLSSLSQALQVVDARHPVIAQALAQVEAAREGVTLAKAQMRPKVDLTVSRQVNPYSLASQTVSQVTVNMPVFNGGAGDAAVRGAVGQLQATQTGLEEQTLVLREKVGNAWTEWQTAGRHDELSTERARAGALLVENYRAQFRLARRSLLDLLNVQNEVYGYQASAVQATFDARIARLKLWSAMGQLADMVKDGRLVSGGAR